MSCQNPEPRREIFFFPAKVRGRRQMGEANMDAWKRVERLKLLAWDFQEIPSLPGALGLKKKEKYEHPLTLGPGIPSPVGPLSPWTPCGPWGPWKKLNKHVNDLLQKSIWERRELTLTQNQ